MLAALAVAAEVAASFAAFAAIVEEVLASGLRQSKSESMAKVSALIREHAGDLAKFLSEDPKGRQLPGYLAMLSETLNLEQQRSIVELESIRQNIEHVNEIVAMQQNYAKVSGVSEVLKPTDLVEDALRMNAAALATFQAIRRDGTQRGVLERMQSRADLYKYLGYDAFEQQLDRLFAAGKGK